MIDPKHGARLACGLVALTQVAVVQAQESVPDVVYDRAAAHAVSGPRLMQSITCESHGNPAAVGDSGHSHGLVQLSDLPTGLLAHFHAQGYGSAYSAYESADYLARVMAGEWAGEGVTLARWSCSRGAK